jgi:putative transposase
VSAALGFQWDGTKARLFARTCKGSYNTARLISFLRQLKRFAHGHPVILIWDGLPAHRSREMTAFLCSQRDWLQVERLPAYAPDLNPTEGVWNNIKSREMANLCPELMSETTAAFRRGLQRLSHTRRLPFSFLRHTGLFF